LLLRRLVARVLADHRDLAIAVSGVLLRVQLVRRGGLARKAVMPGEFAEDARGRPVGTAVHRLDKGEERDALERAAVLAARTDHLDRGERPRRGVGAVRLLPRDAGVREELQHDVDVRLLAAELLHEVLHHDVHERVVPFARDVRNDVAEEDGVRPHPQVVLDLTEDDLLARPAMLDDALEPRMVRHEESVRDVPQLRDERVRLLCDHVATVGVLAKQPDAFIAELWDIANGLFMPDHPWFKGIVEHRWTREQIILGEIQHYLRVRTNPIFFGYIVTNVASERNYALMDVVMENFIEELGGEKTHVDIMLQFLAHAGITREEADRADPAP